MIRVVVDTNILISAVLSPQGMAARVLLYERHEKIELAFSPATCGEVFRVLDSPKIKDLLKKRGVPLRKVQAFLKALIGNSVSTGGSVEVDAIKDDPSDNMFLACALEAEADFIVSDDAHLNSLKSFHGIQIVDTAVFLKVMERMK